MSVASDTPSPRLRPTNMPAAVSTPSPRLRPVNNNDGDPPLPTGHCRYLLLMPELRGQRCGCTHFNLNRATPNAICECGHLACFHVNNDLSTAPSENPDTEILEQRLQFLESEYAEMQKFRREFLQWQGRANQDHDRAQELVVRVSELEENVEKTKTDINTDVREAYRNLGRAWDSITDLEHYRKNADNHIRHINDHLRNVDTEVARIGERQMELVDVNISLEERLDACESLDERVEKLEQHRCVEVRDDAKATQAQLAQRRPPPPIEHVPANPRPPPRSPSHSPLSLDRAATPTTAASRDHQGRRRSPEHTNVISSPLSSLTPQQITAIRSSISGDASGSSADTWTVHISLLPTATQPFPFERDTTAYFRCLSRGLHRMVPVQGSSADAFEAAVFNAFSAFLGGNAWMPLQALPCTAERLTGLPMLRQLDPSLVNRKYDQRFLGRHCAVCDCNGKIESLYIAMRSKTISWHKLRKAPVFVDNLETCWDFDPLLDAAERDNSNEYASSEDEVMGGMCRPPAGDIIATLPSLKRAASEMLRSSSLGSSGAAVPMPMSPTTSETVTAAPTTAVEGEGSRPKVPRIYPLPNLVEVRRGVPTS